MLNLHRNSQFHKPTIKKKKRDNPFHNCQLLRRAWPRDSGRAGWGETRPPLLHDRCRTCLISVIGRLAPGTLQCKRLTLEKFFTNSTIVPWGTPPFFIACVTVTHIRLRTIKWLLEILRVLRSLSRPSKTRNGSVF